MKATPPALTPPHGGIANFPRAASSFAACKNVCISERLLVTIASSFVRDACMSPGLFYPEPPHYAEPPPYPQPPPLLVPNHASPTAAEAPPYFQPRASPPPAPRSPLRRLSLPAHTPCSAD